MSPVQAADGITVTATAFSSFDYTSGPQRFGALTFVGGLDLVSSDPRFGGWSSIRFRPDAAHFVGVLDTGHFLTGTLQRGPDGAPTGVADAAIAPMQPAEGYETASREDVDSEGLAFRGDDVLVSFERRHRVEVFAADGFPDRPPRQTQPSPIDPRALRANGGMEFIGVAPADSPLAGALVTIAERSVDRDGNLLGAIADGPLKGNFSLLRRDGYAVTDGVFLPNGDLLLLQRRFTLATGMGARIERIAAADLKPGTVVSGTVLFEAAMDRRIDNMEGLDAFQAADGSTHLVLVSDDNHSLLQRTLLLEFRLDGNAAAASQPG